MLKHIEILRRASQNNCLDIVYTAITQLAQEYTRTSPKGPNVWIIRIIDSLITLVLQGN